MLNVIDGPTLTTVLFLTHLSRSQTSTFGFLWLRILLAPSRSTGSRLGHTTGGLTTASPQVAAGPHHSAALPQHPRLRSRLRTRRGGHAPQHSPQTRLSHSITRLYHSSMSCRGPTSTPTGRPQHHGALDPSSPLPLLPIVSAWIWMSPSQ